MNVTPSFSIRLDVELREALEKLAKADKRTLAGYIKIVLEEHVESAKKIGKLPKK
jgi:predicted DNA-binding protein